MLTYLIIFARYHEVYLGIHTSSGAQAFRTESSKKISRDFTAILEALLRETGLTLKDIDFIAVHQGPAPFTTLRATLASAQGLAYATGIKLVGVDGLRAFLQEQHDSVGGKVTIALLNAFAGDVYYGISWGEHTDVWCVSIEDVLAQIQKISEPIRLIGNGVIFYYERIRDVLPSVEILNPIPEMVTPDFLGKLACQKFMNEGGESQILPIYLKGNSSYLKIS